MDFLLSVYQDNYRLFYSIAYKYTNNQHDTEDIVQEMIYKALRADKSNVEEKDLKKWLVVICTNAAKDFLRAKRKFEPKENIEQLVTSIETNHLDDFYYTEILEAALITVPEEIRIALEKNITEDISIRQIARDSGISRDKLRYWKTHLKKVIKNFLK